MSFGSEFHVNGASELAAHLRRAADRLPVVMAMVVEKSAVDLTALTQQNASHRPGPNAPTGDYRASWRPERLASEPESVAFSVGTDRPQARRLEYGFVGPDSLGRVYDQAPLPHHGPAVDVIGPNFEQAMEKAVEKTVNG